MFGDIKNEALIPGQMISGRLFTASLHYAVPGNKVRISVSSDAGDGSAYSERAFILIKPGNTITASCGVAFLGALLIVVPSQTARSGSSLKNSWRRITPLRSSAADVARLIGAESDSSADMPVGPFKVEGGEVTFSYLTPSLAKIYRAPRSMVGKVFTIYFKPYQPMARADLALGAGFKRCQEEREKSYYYYVSSAGLAYQLLRSNDRVENIIYQPSSVEVRSLAVNTECVF